MSRSKENIILAQHDSYATPAGKKATLFARVFPGVTASFYLQILNIVFKASKLGKQGKYTTEEWTKSALAVIKALENVGIKVSIHGMKNIAKANGPVVFIGNHMSVLETFVLPAIIPPVKEVTFVVKQSLIDYPVFRHVMRARDPIVVGRTQAREDLTRVLNGGTERLKAGISMIIFPQSTRMMHLDKEKFNTLGIKLARKANVPVIPFAVKTDAWGNGKLIKDFGKILLEN
jgi:1-acyl-sn-glycerol-3-phosphate acyltransferase